MIVVFLDRDGVINRNRDDYVKTVDELVFLPGAFEGLARLREAGIPAVVVSNQAGVGRGVIDPNELERIDRKLAREVSDHGGNIAASYYCMHRKDAGCDCRKPGIGLFRRASDEKDIDLVGSYYIGDSSTDIQAGDRAGLRTVLVLTGLATLEDVGRWDIKPEHIAADLPGAVHWILTAK